MPREKTHHAPDPLRSIIRRVEDVELGLGDFPGGPLDRDVRGLTDAQASALEGELDYLLRGEPDPVVRNRLHGVIAFLRRDAERRQRVNAEQRIQDLGSLARRTGRETCECGERHEPGAHYYATAVDGPRVALLSGPYPTHAEALAALPEAREKALRVDPKSHFYSFGTVATDVDRPGVLDPL